MGDPQTDLASPSEVKGSSAQPVWLRGGTDPGTRRCQVRFQVRAHAWVLGSVPSRDMRRQPIGASRCPFLFLSLRSMKTLKLKIKKEEKMRPSLRRKKGKAADRLRHHLKFK